MRLLTVVGARPQFIKAAALSRAIAASAGAIQEQILHTGQHYSYEMDGVFFEELELPLPHLNIAIGSRPAEEQLAAMEDGLRPVFEREHPAWVMVEGDTNSVLAAANAAHGTGHRVGHVEAGLRSYDLTMPEERNRIATDRIADQLYRSKEDAIAVVKVPTRGGV